MILLEFLYHGGDLGWSDWFMILVTLLANLFLVLLPFILGGLAIYVLRKKKSAKDV